MPPLSAGTESMLPITRQFIPSFLFGDPLPSLCPVPNPCFKTSSFSPTSAEVTQETLLLTPANVKPPFFGRSLTSLILNSPLPA